VAACTGKLVKEIYVLIAAHCAYGRKEESIGVIIIIQYFYYNKLHVI